MASEVGVRDVARSHCLVDSGGDVALGDADQHVGHEVHEVESHERLQEGVGARIWREMVIDTVILRYCDKLLIVTVLIVTVVTCSTVELKVNRREWKLLKGCIFSPPSVRPVPARGREARKRNPSITSIPTPVL